MDRRENRLRVNPESQGRDRGDMHMVHMYKRVGGAEAEAGGYGPGDMNTVQKSGQSRGQDGWMRPRR